MTSFLRQERKVLHKYASASRTSPSQILSVLHVPVVVCKDDLETASKTQAREEQIASVTGSFQEVGVQQDLVAAPHLPGGDLDVGDVSAVPRPRYFGGH